MILRNFKGEVIFASCSYLSSCASALEAELAACREGISLTLEWSTLPFILETDCTIALSMLKGIEVDRSPAAIVEEAKHMLSLGRPHELTHVRRGLNCVSHALAQLGRQPRTAGWLRHAPEHILALCKLDCNAPG
ncbi:LOW QUALITY PROTEIN: hypothetical protein CFC21_094725 [Triticum aestivum]|uniref:RNase H type-1 domain-containing protein n=2 Tax=Triticum aestivum TaxID=4565 RepID=A0A3B6QLB6_WHEAT|nr:LOW QUALITY PROTEIN: hypothetical protein CFC21_094725 [Triticum aestivum]